jgi:hypothetical protein
MSDGERGDLTRAILVRTTGPACGRAQAMMVADPADARDSATDALLAGHLQHCRACRDLAAAWQETSDLLPALADIDPGAAFAADVFARTTRRPVSAWKTRWDRVVARPHFSLEVVYVAACLCVLLVGNPTSIAGAVAERVQMLTSSSDAAVTPGGTEPGSDDVNARPPLDVNHVAPDGWWDQMAARVSVWWKDAQAWVSDIVQRLSALFAASGEPASSGHRSAADQPDPSLDTSAGTAGMGARNLRGHACV